MIPAYTGISLGDFSMARGMLGWGRGSGRGAGRGALGSADRTTGGTAGRGATRPAGRAVAAGAGAGGALAPVAFGSGFRCGVARATAGLTGGLAGGLRAALLATGAGFLADAFAGLAREPRPAAARAAEAFTRLLPAPFADLLRCAMAAGRNPTLFAMQFDS